MLRPYHVENNGSLPITEVMQRRDFVSISMGDRLGIPDDVSFLCSHLTRYITTVIVVVVVVVVVIVDKERFPRNSSDNTTNLCLFQETRTSCLMITLSLCNRSNNGHMVSFQISDATVHQNITYTHSFKANSALTNTTKLHK